ncbi:MAG: N-acetyltransferase family protein [Micromonosporaceae bacterium]
MSEVTVRPADSDAWHDIETLLGQRGSVNGCWCMFFRQTPGQRRTDWGEGNRRALKGLVDAGARPGLVAYRDGVPAGWCSIAPRQEYSRLDRSPISKPVDAEPVWSLVCLFVDRAHRGRGVARALVRAAVTYAREQGVHIVEAYPVDDTMGPVTADSAYHGVVTLLRSEGFEEVARRSPKRPVMRCTTSA